MKIIIEFPLNILATYHGISNLDETIDEYLTIFLGRYFYQNHISFKVLALDIVEPIPNQNDELFRYLIEVNMKPSEFKIDWILQELMHEGYEKGLTIKSIEGNILYADEYTADITYRRKLKNIKK